MQCVQHNIKTAKIGGDFLPCGRSLFLWHAYSDIKCRGFLQDALPNKKHLTVYNLIYRMKYTAIIIKIQRILRFARRQAYITNLAVIGDTQRRFCIFFCPQLIRQS